MGYKRGDLGLERKCLECGDVIQYGRTDKKFCNSVCKNQYHNRIIHSTARMKRQVNEILENNYTVLESLQRLGICTVSLEKLEEMGFDPNYFTWVGKNGCHKEIGCFDLRYSISKNKIFNLRRMSDF